MGAVVEVKNQDGIYQEATINKLTDASLYTVGKCVAGQDKCVRNGWNECVYRRLFISSGLISHYLYFILFVVFDDGDEKTLRRSSLCLKGARHFAESEVNLFTRRDWLVQKCYCGEIIKIIMFPRGKPSVDEFQKVEIQLKFLFTEFEHLFKTKNDIHL